VREGVADILDLLQVLPGDFAINSETVAHDDLRMEGFKGSDLAVEHSVLIFGG
jgi:hypothetical protein